jgi:hypothetical protein
MNDGSKTRSSLSKTTSFSWACARSTKVAISSFHRTR